MRKHTRLLAFIMTFIVLLGMMPMSVVKVNSAAKKPTIAKKTTVEVGKKKTLKIVKNGYTINKIVSAKSSKKSVAKVTVKGKKVKVTGKKAGKSKVTIVIRAKKKGKTKKFKLKTTVTVKKATVEPTPTPTTPTTEVKPETKPEPKSEVDQIIDKMSLDQKVSQLIMPSFDIWGDNEESVTDLSKVPELAEALRRHQYGGFILFEDNIEDTEQTVRLISDLQKNNAQAGGLPYLVASDQEGGQVNRFVMGTRGTGSMAIGASGDKTKNDKSKQDRAVTNANAIGQVFGEEMEALGVNVDLGPCVDVIKDLGDLGLNTRVYSDDADTNAALGMAFTEGVSQGSKNTVITTYKHFPGAGDGSDYPTSIGLTLEELRANGLEAYKQVIEGGAEMVMTSATTFPGFDDEHLMADGVTKGYYPATVSPKIVTGLLRNELGFDGVVITDALEMDQFITEPDKNVNLFPGDAHSVEHDVIVAQKCIEAGCDILLLPRDLSDNSRVDYYDGYINGIIDLIKKGEISEERINESVRRILTLKKKHGILDMKVDGSGLDQKIADAKITVGSDAHHAVEIETAKQAVTLVKNEDTLPLEGHNKKIVFVGNAKHDNTPITYAINQLIEAGLIDENAYIDNHITGESSGVETADTKIIIDYFYKDKSGQLVYPAGLTESIQDADAVVCFSKLVAGTDQLQDSNPIMQGISQALEETHNAGKKFVLLSTNLPMDTKRFTEADAIVCAFMAAGYDVNPLDRTDDSENVGAYNVTVPAAICAMFDSPDKMTGTMPIDIPGLVKGEDGIWSYTTEE